MHRLLVLSICLSMALTFSARASSGEWSPDAKTVARLESTLDLSVVERTTPGSKMPVPLEKYARFYAGVMVKGHRMIRGVLLLANPPGIKIVLEKDLPGIMDGGCGIINLLYDPQAGRAVWMRCNGLA